MQVRIIVNPVSGGARGERQGKRLCQALRSRGAAVELVVTHAPGDATTATSKPGPDCVVAVGGDGTVNEVANGLTVSKATLAILPVGTVNTVAHELNVPSNPEALAALIFTGTVRSVDAGVCNGRRFLLSAGAGFDAAVVHDVHARRRSSLRVYRYIVPVMRTIRTYRFPPIRAVVDGATFCENGDCVVVGNCAHSAGLLVLTPRARLDDGMLDVCAACEIGTRLYPFRVIVVARLVAAAWLDTLGRQVEVASCQAHKLTLESADGAPVPLQIDGDPAGFLPATVRIEPGAIPVIAPAG